MTTSNLPAGRVKLANVRLAFPKFWNAEQVNGAGAAKFSAAFLMPPGHPSLAAIDAAVQKVAVAKWGKDAAATLKALKLGDKLPVHDGDAKPTLSGYPGNFYLNASTATRPQIVDRDGKTPITADDNRIDSGDPVNAGVDVWAQDHPQHGKRVNAALAWVQFVKVGDRFRASASVTSGEIDDLGVEDEESALV